MVKLEYDPFGKLFDKFYAQEMESLTNRPVLDVEFYKRMSGWVEKECNCQVERNKLIFKTEEEAIIFKLKYS